MPNQSTTYQNRLIERFVSVFERYDEMIAARELDPIAWSLAQGEPDTLGFLHWRPARNCCSRSCLEEIYARLPGRFPPLFERLVLSYRWAEVDLGRYRLLANPPGTNLHGLLQQMSDRGLWDALIPAGFVQFAKGPDLNYDPVCFDMKSRNKRGDCRIVRIDHEEILCNYRVKVVAGLASSFEQLVLDTINGATQEPGAAG